ncbi:bifunctional (p)ppGpp synthetase/guanosine-3',5'-bis(diphosphate) 3'-pyrophosphohydrolase [Isoptericola sp. b441]|uniref:Bifunctional (P)ppGpp synthetase/guanosine-3',5'-bis(Diphosphate) 3'-pyrophosphohydrolase n=1 Tax=Actinotalea lenta TaxID=3064654 RepID=A0ABT9DBX3_9CELL|nr:MULTISPECIES: bifunctional (p)ppGpp synthetase/guanosine-3',5'-bis(diphosphate) 3'-pyrophosphohydrolase [unclassified Isoptericola]MDO8107814.1 bifunctional (p)ppGpp synthetase/guanosine-3',5'-bis(diphosphate) 3'-pyrophosphohydrolase [Isoptericola sp. b441]MDO8120515.1 bifunctional (p)ppGpp synthetase/guanosine-3',5'-bis(diphosphate) 3'-pyrophosphohydrolase [Isoptericola sp. b490]
MSDQDVAGPAVPVAAAAPETSSASRNRTRWERLVARSVSPTPPALEPVLQAVRANHPKADVGVLLRAYEVAETAHRGQLRKSGDPYITHPVAVATILAELGMTTSTLAAALLHDTVEDTDYSLDRLRSEFGEEVAKLVDGVTKLDKVVYGEAAQAETVRKMVVAMARDIRVLVIKLADRLHNARTWKYVSAESAERKARETLEIYAPLAHRLGMNTIKWELEDLSFHTLYPKVFDEIVRLVSERAPARDEYLTQVREQVTADLRTAKIRATVTSRPKHYYSIYQKMIVRGRDFSDIYDLVGVRVLVDTVRDCYAALGALHARWNPVPGRFKDYIAMPKFNMYQSLHTTVIGPGGKPVEIQIRTHDMHRRAEYGIAAHWKYKDQAKHPKGGAPDAATDMAWLRQLVDWQQETADPNEFLDSLRFEIRGSEVYVFTPKGEVIALPSGSTPVDFAYAVHTEVGHRTMGARVNNRLVPLDSELENGDVVEVLTSKSETAGPSQDWLTFVKSPRARNKIRQWFSKERREEAIEHGKDAIAKAMRKQNLPIQRLLSHEALVTLANEMRYADVSALYAAVGEQQVSAQTVVHKLVQSLGGESSAEEDLAEVTRPGQARTTSRGGESGVSVKGVGDVWTKLAKCCTPVPGDEIIGFITRGAGVSVHRADCGNLAGLRDQPERIVEVEWAPGAGTVFLVQIQVEAIDRSRLLSDVTRVLSDHHVNILSATVSTSRDRVAISRFVFEMAETTHLNSVLAAVRKVDGVYDVYRITGAAHLPE